MNALVELTNAQQVADERRRRWFTSTEMDLFIWYDGDESIAGFELYYDKSRQEHVFAWRRDRGFAHLAVDDGEQKPVLNYKQAPILVPDGNVDPERIRRLFDAASENLPDDVADLVRRALTRYPGA